MVVAYGKLLPAWLLELPRYGALNLHGSLLPRYRGAAPIQWAMANGESETGVCVMKLDEGLDTGPVYACEKTAIDPEETSQQLSERLADLGLRTGAAKRRGHCRGHSSSRPAGSCARDARPDPEKGRMGTSTGAFRLGRSTTGFARFIHGRERERFFGTLLCRILKSRVARAKTSETVRRREHWFSARAPNAFSGRFAVTVLLELLEVQLPNRKPQTGLDFVNGFGIAPGEKLRHVE